MRLNRLVLVLFSLFIAASVISAAPVVIKMGNIAPERSPWGEALNKLAADWKRLSGGEVELKLYHGGVVGNETEMIGKIRLNQLQAGVMTSSGLSTLSPEVMSISIPFMLRNDDEVAVALEGTKSIMEEAISKKGFQVLAWSKVGWVHFFSKKQVKTPSDLKALKLAAGVQNDTFVQAFKQLGFQILPVPTTELITALNSGMVEAFYSDPMGAAGYQWFGAAPYLLDLPVAPFVGVVVIGKNAWNRVPAKHRAALKAATQEMASSLDGSIRELGEKARGVMKDNGLVLYKPTETEIALWKADMEAGIQKTLGSVFPLDMYDAIQAALKKAGLR